MIANIVVALCIWQIAFGQEDPEQAIQDFIDQRNDQVDKYINPLMARIQNFSNSFSDEDNQLQQEYTDLREELENITSVLGNDSLNVSTCLDAALQDAYAIYQDRANELTAYSSVAFNGLSQIMYDFTLVSEEARGLLRSSGLSLQYCSRLNSTEDLDACYDAFLTTFDEMTTDILNRFSEVHLLGDDVVTVAEEELQTFRDGNRQFVMESAEETRQELTSCIQNL